MAVKIVDRHGNKWEYSRGTKCVVGAQDKAADHLYILDANDALIGGFNEAAWASYALINKDDE